MANERTIPKETVIAMIRRAGYPPERIDEIASKLPDPVDLDREASLLAKYGLTRNQMMDRRGGNP